MIRLVMISDTHGIHAKIPPLPRGDVLIHAGDLTGWGTYSEMEYVAAWMGQQDFALRIAIAGNHDECAVAEGATVKRMFDNHEVVYLNDSYCYWTDDDGRILKIWGTPYTPEFCGWHFMEYEEQLAERYAKIPDDVDVLICHGPPRGILDESGLTLNREWDPRTQKEIVKKSRDRCGSTALMDRISQLDNLKLFVCGHIHYGRGILHENGVVYVNAASLGENYEPVQEEAIVINL